MSPLSKEKLVSEFILNHSDMPMKEVARQLDVSYSTVAKYNKKLGIKRTLSRKYHEGDRIGPYNILFLERTTKDRGKFVCPFDDNIFESNISSVGTGLTRSCGCLHSRRARENTFVDITGQKFGKLTALYPTGESTNDGRAIWHCKCDCGNEIDTTGKMLRTGHKVSCGCSNSKGEVKLEQILQQLNIQYEKQKAFEGFVNENNRKYLFDFYLPDYNCCIEYDGKQHFSYSESGWNTRENFEKTVKNDQIKNEYCRTHNILLVRIPYTFINDLDEEFLLNELEKVGCDVSSISAYRKNN